ncbi:MAG: molybdopterin molybdotransferase MoeA [Polyangiales bacterium]
MHVDAGNGSSTKMLDLEEAQDRLLADVRRLGPERVVLDCAVGRVLADDVIANVDLPPFDHSAMDGYALRHGAASRLRVVGESRAGGPAPDALAANTAMRIFTGAPLPLGADAVVMQEATSRDGDMLTLTSPSDIAIGDHIRRAGEDLARGSLALKGGLRLRATHLPLLASMEITRATVVRRPVVAILATGDELRDAGAPIRPGSIVETNGPTLSALCHAHGAIARLLPVAFDRVDALRSALVDALEGADVVLTIGGVSVGDHDLVRPVLQEIGVVLDFYKVALKPGKPLVVGRRGRTHVLGLPGNPVSAIVTFLLFAGPLLRKLAGETTVLPNLTPARLGRDLRHTPGRTELVRATITRESAGLVATPVLSQASGSVVSIASADALVMVPKDSRGIAEGSNVDVILL